MDSCKFEVVPQLIRTGDKLKFHIDLFCHFRHYLGHFVEYLDVEGQPVVTYAEFEEEKNWERFSF